MHYHKLRYLFERHVGSGGSDEIINGLDETLNFRGSFLLIKVNNTV